MLPKQLLRYCLYELIHYDLKVRGPKNSLKGFIKLKQFTRIVFALALCCVGMFGQTVASSLEGVVVDPADAAVANAPVTLINSDTKATRTANTDNTGTYRFLQVDPGNYSVTVKATGFKAETQTGIVIAAQETH